MYKTLLVPVDGRSRSARSLGMAAKLAGPFDAHVVGLFVKPSAHLPSYVLAEGGEEALRESTRKRIDALAQEARAQFDAGVKAGGIARHEWRVAEGDAAETVALHARYADLVVVNQTDSADDDRAHFADKLLMSVSRPVLIVPYVGEIAGAAQNVMACWNATAEAARALTDALPLLQRARKVTVLSVKPRGSPQGHGESAGSDIALYLARHGVRAETASTAAADVDVGNLILSRAFDLGADLIVMGAYGHSRLREMVLGGATRTVLSSMTAPVLMSH